MGTRSDVPQDRGRHERCCCQDDAKDDTQAGQSWPLQIYKTLKAHGVSQISYVPDAGHSRLIELSHGDAAIQTTVLTTEEEGVALSPAPGSAATARCC